MIIAAVRSVITYIAVSLYVLIVGPIGMLLALLFGWKGHLYVLGHIGVRLGLALCGIRYRVAPAQPLPLDRAAVYCANHQSNVDPPLLFHVLHPRMHILYKARDRCDSGPGARVPDGRVHSGRSAQQGSGACDRSMPARRRFGPATRS